MCDGSQLLTSGHVLCV